MIGIIQEIEDGKVYIQVDNGQLFILPIDCVEYINPHVEDQVFLIRQEDQWKAIRRKENKNKKLKKLATLTSGIIAVAVFLSAMVMIGGYVQSPVQGTISSGSTVESNNGESSANTGLIEISKNNPNPVIFQDKNFWVQASTITYSDDIYHFHFSVTNNTDKNIYIDVTQANVDDDSTWISPYSYGTYDNVGVKNTTTQVDAGGIKPNDLEKLGLADYKVLKLEVTIQDTDDNEIGVVNISVPRTMLPSP